MHGEISKRPFGEDKEKKHYQSVNMQMGRVQLDSDWNEAFATLLQAGQRAYRDIIGKEGGPNHGFRIDKELLIAFLDSKEGWECIGDEETCKVSYSEKLGGRGSLQISGKITLKTNFIELLKHLPSGTPTQNVLLYYKVTGEAATKIELTIGEKSISVQDLTPDGWKSIALDISAISVSDSLQLEIHIETDGFVYLGKLSLEPDSQKLKGDVNDFYIQGGNGTSEGAGRYYVNGLACVKESFETYTTQQDYPEPPGIDLADNAPHLVYLDAWQRTITAIEDPDIQEVALDGPDTCTREKLIAQVKVFSSSKDETMTCKTNIKASVRPHEPIRLSVQLAPHPVQKECDFKPELDYTGLDNALYRIEIHGDNFKWSRNNGSDLVPIKAFGPDNQSVIVDDASRLCVGDWVELSDDVSDLADSSDTKTKQYSILAIVKDITPHEDGFLVSMDKNIEPFKNRSDEKGPLNRHPKLRKWDGVHKIDDFQNVDTHGDPTEELEHGIRLAFSQGHPYHGDYWQFTARANTRDIERLHNELPMGPLHHYAPLSVIHYDKTKQELIFEDCRKPFPPLTEIEEIIEKCKYYSCCDEVVLPGDSIEDAINRIRPEGGTVCLAPGIHIVRHTIRIEERKNLVIRGCGQVSRVIYYPDEANAGETQGNQKNDLFCITSSQKITFENLVLFSCFADSLVGLLGENKNITISHCDFINLETTPTIVAETLPLDFIELLEKLKMLEKLAPCIRITDCTNLSIENSRLLGQFGMLQQGADVSDSVPLIHGLTCCGNVFCVSWSGIVLLEGKRVLIQNNHFIPYDPEIIIFDDTMFDNLINEILSADEPFSDPSNQEMNAFIDELVQPCFSDTYQVPILCPSHTLMIGLYILQDSRIEQNRLSGLFGIQIYYSRNNEIANNSVTVIQTAFSLIYSFNTRVSGNTFVMKNPNGDHVIQHHFSDLLTIEDNQLKGRHGLVATRMPPAVFITILAALARVWDTPNPEKAMTVLANRLADLLGLRLTISFFETLIKTFSPDSDIDLIEQILIEMNGTAKEQTQKSPFIKILSMVLVFLLKMPYISRSMIAKNRFDVTAAGIMKTDGMALGGNRIMENHFFGAANTAILWKTNPIFSNPELCGFLIECLFSLFIESLTRLKAFLERLLHPDSGSPQSGSGNLSPFFVIFTTYLLHGIGKNQPFAKAIEAIKAIVNALTSLIDQLSHEDTRQIVSAFASSDNRINQNHIRGRGTGIHTNLANTIIAENRIDIEPGISCVADLFAIGRLLATHAQVLNHTGLNSRSSVVLLAQALMSLDPHILEAAGQLLSKYPSQWVGLRDVLQTILDFKETPLTAEIIRLIKKMIDTLPEALERIPFSYSAIVDRAASDIRQPSKALIEEFEKHFKGYGMLLESPGMQVIQNRVEAISSCDATEGLTNEAPGGVLMSGGSDFISLVIYSFLAEEVLPLMNLGGQGTLFSDNSLQWGAGHGLSLSSLPIMVDVKIKNNEIQNHGLSGVLCDKILFQIPFKKLVIAENEINQCFRHKALGISVDPLPASPMMLGGLMVRNAAEVHCFGNTIRACGKEEGSWPAYGSLFMACRNVTYESNKIIENGQTLLFPGKGEETIFDELFYFPRGGALFLSSYGYHHIVNNTFVKNLGDTLLVFPLFALRLPGLCTGLDMGAGKFICPTWPSIPCCPFSPWSYWKCNYFEIYYSLILLWLRWLCVCFGYCIEFPCKPPTCDAEMHTKLLALGNTFEIDDQSPSHFAKIFIGYSEQLSFSQNQVSLSNSDDNNWNGLSLTARRLLFNGNMVTGDSIINPVRLFGISKCAAVGNLTDAELSTAEKCIKGHNA